MGYLTYGLASSASISTAIGLYLIFTGRFALVEHTAELQTDMAWTRARR